MKEIFGGILMAFGILVAGASGLCSLVALFSGGVGGDLNMLPLILLFGGIPFAVGAGIAYGGYALIRSARKNPDHDTTFE